MAVGVLVHIYTVCRPAVSNRVCLAGHARTRTAHPATPCASHHQHAAGGRTRARHTPRTRRRRPPPPPLTSPSPPPLLPMLT
eukprot:scaffold233722_cov28-Tisochrysis_lutea.AAC.1